MIPDGHAGTHDGLTFQHITLTVTTGNLFTLIVDTANLKGLALVHLVATLNGHIILVVSVLDANTRTILRTIIGMTTFPYLTNDNMGVQDILQTSLKTIAVISSGKCLYRVTLTGHRVVVVYHGGYALVKTLGLIPAETQQL